MHRQGLLMTEVWLDPGSHGVRFYESESSTHDSIADFFTAGAAADDPLLLVSRRETFEGVTHLLASGRYGPPITADRIHFVDAEAALAQMMIAGALDPVRAKALFENLIDEVRSRHPRGTIRWYGEAVDFLCERGQFDVALEIEEIAGRLFAFEPRLSILCGYAWSHFHDGANASRFRAICGQHTHGTAAGTAAEPPAQGKPPLASEPPSAAVYVIDDDVSIRRSLERLLSLTEWRAVTFDSAEAFLAALDGLSPGCLVVDIQLGGMSGLDLLDVMKTRRPTWPAVAMSGSHNDGAEREALRLGARAFLHKPFDPQSLLDAIALALA
jgi:CheY-like chemotaxis protein